MINFIKYPTKVKGLNLLMTLSHLYMDFLFYDLLHDSNKFLSKIKANKDLKSINAKNMVKYSSIF